jgi:ABC-type Zn uptake system ZnuABC Zn-binding protein ZnuA
MIRKAFLAAVAAVLPMAAACQPAAPTPAPKAILRVVATYSILGDLTQNVGGEHIELRTLVGPGQDTHTFEPSPADGAALAEADLVLENGLEFETWLDELYASSGSQAARVVVTEGITARAMEEEHADEEEHAGEEEHEHGEFDPHVWHSAANAIQMVTNIREALAEADPPNEEAYRAKAEAYLAQLQELDTWVFQQVKALPEARRKLVTTHDTFGYFAERYGFEVLGSALGATTEAANPAAGEVANLVEEIRATGVPAIFAENIANPELMQQIADEAGVTLAPTLYTDALGEPGSQGDTYLKMMRYNVTTIVTALGR